MGSELGLAETAHRTGSAVSQLTSASGRTTGRAADCGAAEVWCYPLSCASPYPSEPGVTDSTRASTFATYACGLDLRSKPWAFM